MHVGHPALAGAMLVAVLAGCASTPADPVTEQLDQRTGTTVVALRHPVEFLATVARGQGADPYAFAGPFETNEMGRRRTWLWVSTPEPQDQVAEPPRLVCDGRALALEAVPASAPGFGLSRDPYEQPTAWNSRWYYGLDGPSLACLAAAKDMQIMLRTREGEVRGYASTDGAAEAIAAFRSRVGGAP